MSYQDHMALGIRVWSLTCVCICNCFCNLSGQVMTKNLEQVVSMVLNSFQDPHARVRWAAISAIGQLSTDFGPDLQSQYHYLVLPALVSAMDDFQNPRVQVDLLTIIVLLHVSALIVVFAGFVKEPTQPKA